MSTVTSVKYLIATQKQKQAQNMQKSNNELKKYIKSRIVNLPVRTRDKVNSKLDDLDKEKLVVLSNALALKNSSLQERMIDAMMNFFDRYKEEDLLKHQQAEERRKLEHEELTYSRYQEKAHIPLNFREASIKKLNKEFLAHIMQYFKSRCIEHFVIYGGLSYGKTYASCAILNNLIKQGHTKVYYLHNSKLDPALNNYENINDIVEKLNKYDVLVLDDLGISTLTDKKAQLIIGVLKTRSANAKRTICVYADNKFNTGNANTQLANYVACSQNRFMFKEKQTNQSECQKSTDINSNWNTPNN